MSQNLGFVVLFLAFTVSLGLTLLRMHLDPNPVFGERPTWSEVVSKYAPGESHGRFLKGKTVVLTGGTDGIGVETAKAFVHLGAHVILGARNLDKASSVMERIYNEVGRDKGTIEARLLDAASMQSVSSFAATIQSPVHILVLNAGTMNVGGFSKTRDGFEEMFATNYLSGALLTLKLLDRLASARSSRIVYVASYGPYISATSRDKLKMSDFEWTPEKLATRLPLLGPMEMYANSKVAGMLFFRELARREGAAGIKTYLAHPGMMATSIGQDRPSSNESTFGTVQRYLKAFGQNLFMNSLPGLKSVSEGAATQVYCASAPELEDKSGRYYADVQESESTAATRDDVLAAELYEWTLKQLNRF